MKRCNHLALLAMVLSATSASSAQVDELPVDKNIPAEGEAESAKPCDDEQHVRKANRLIHATSPFLRQHAFNFVDWYEWGDEALETAKRENKPIFIHVGYVTCHWCRVMNDESFEFIDLGRFMNQRFVNIMIDREERPDLDELFIAHAQWATGRAGWPLSIWLTPDAVPIYAATYTPTAVLAGNSHALVQKFSESPDEIEKIRKTSLEHFKYWTRVEHPVPDVPVQDEVDKAALEAIRKYDSEFGGKQAALPNKFPPTMSMDLLLRVYRRTGNAELLQAVKLTLDNMARGGVYDHLSGGVFRNSTDAQWLIPRFPKMLPDQAMASSIYLDAHQAARDPLYATVARDTLNYVLRELRSPEGVFYAGRDGDSDGYEGAYYVWTPSEVKQVLAEKDAELFCKYYGVSEDGNWIDTFGHAPPGQVSVLRTPQSAEAFAEENGLEPQEFECKLEAWREKLRIAQARRVQPALDDLIVTGWNGLMIASLAKGGRILDEPKYTEAAARAARFILDRMQRDDRLYATYRLGRPRFTAYATDYAYLIEGLLNLYEADFDVRWLDKAVALMETSIQYYYDEQDGGFFLTAHDGEKLLARPKQRYDTAVPSSNSVQAMNLLRLALLFNRSDYRAKAETIFRSFGEELRLAPWGYERLWCAVDFYHDKVTQVAVIGDPTARETKELLRTIYDRYIPNKIIALAANRQDDSKMPLLKGRERLNGQSTAYIGGERAEAITVPNELARRLDTN